MRRVLFVALVFVCGAALGWVRARGPVPARPAVTAPVPPAITPHRVTLVTPDRTVRDLPVIPDSDRPARPGEWGVVLVTVREDGTRDQLRLVLTDMPPIPDLAP